MPRRLSATAVSVQDRAPILKVRSSRVTLSPGRKITARRAPRTVIAMRLLSATAELGRRRIASDSTPEIANAASATADQ